MSSAQYLVTLEGSKEETVVPERKKAKYAKVGPVENASPLLGGEPPIGRKQYMTCSRAIATANIGQHAKIYGEGSGFAKLWSMQAIGFRSYFGYTEFLYVDLIFCQGSMFPLLLSVYTLELVGLQLCFSLIVVTCRVVLVFWFAIVAPLLACVASFIAWFVCFKLLLLKWLLLSAVCV
ncbi:hypothetical protein POTOM_035245 [Populus tomentosa]|uniref:Uncharacterized protein n=1 Tax=Populus tomentosa TaxID=118781 RepID=A0A8X8CLX8_POPTO|nr:hypothetical protein POTOM_035245 [Populus tomentosa]